MTYITKSNSAYKCGHLAYNQIHVFTYKHEYTEIEKLTIGRNLRYDPHRKWYIGVEVVHMVMDAWYQHG